MVLAVALSSTFKIIRYGAEAPLFRGFQASGPVGEIGFRQSFHLSER